MKQERREIEEVIVEEKGKQKATLAFKLASDIEATTDIEEILETRILDSKVEHTMMNW